MFRLNRSKRPIIENSQIVSVANVVREDLLKAGDLNLNEEADVQKFIKFVEINTTLNLKQEINGKAEYSTPNRLKLTYTKSNLKKGFIFWFICNGCNRKTRFLYFPAFSESLLCRQCHRLVYEKQNKTRDKLVSRLLVDPDLRSRYLNSGSHKLALAAIEASWLVEKGLDEVKKRVDKLFKEGNNSN